MHRSVSNVTQARWRASGSVFGVAGGRRRSRMNSTMSSVPAPGVKTSATPSFFSSGMSSAGIVPPTVTRTSSTPCSCSSSTTFGTSVMWAPERIERPTASASSWITVSAICSGVWCSPV